MARGITVTIKKLGKAAGIYAHLRKLRLTCALFMLRNGADVFPANTCRGTAIYD